MSEFRLSSFGCPVCGEDATEIFLACFRAAASCPHPTVIIDSGEYTLSGNTPIPLSSGMTVLAEGAVFRYPRAPLADGEHMLFYGEDVCDLTFRGGRFRGHVYDPLRDDNVWQPHTSAGGIFIRRTPSGEVKNIFISHITAEGLSAPAVYVGGCRAPSGEPLYAEQIDLRDCNLILCGRFMWDYGYLWQRITFAEQYSAEEVAAAYRFMPSDLISSEISLRDGALYADVMPKMDEGERDSVTFFGSEMPKGIVRGKRYFVCNKGAENGLLIAEDEGGTPLSLTVFPKGVRLFRNLYRAYHDLFAPIGNPSHLKGAFDLTLCRHATVSGCRVSAAGDSMHILECENVVFANNQIIGSRMGAFYIGFFCNNVTVTGNTVYGTNGSRVLSIERSTKNVTVTGNTFMGGGRGLWINQPENLIISDNIMTDNTQKCTPDIAIGRLCHTTGDFEEYPEIYITRWQEGARWGNVIIRSNIIRAGERAEAVFSFHPGGHDILVLDNMVIGGSRNIHVADGCEMPVFRGNTGLGEITAHTFYNTANAK